MLTRWCYLPAKMRVVLSLSRWIPVALALGLALPSCKDVLPSEETGNSDDDDDDDDSNDSGGTTFVPLTSGDPAEGSTTQMEGGFDETGPGMGGECSFFTQDCNDGEKCVPWSELPDLIPDEIRCCPVQEPVAQAGDICTVQGYLGSCLDNCVKGTMCLDIDGDGTGVCQQMCGGEPEDPKCDDAEEECFIYYSGVPLCFSTCDPLIQNCPSDKGCYPDAIAEGGTGFLCMPTVGDNGLGDYCWLLSACNPGMICATPNVLPNCHGDADDAGCCTDLCDITEPDACSEIHPDLECVSWYYGDLQPPSQELQNVGACVIPTMGGGA